MEKIENRKRNTIKSIDKEQKFLAEKLMYQEYITLDDAFKYITNNVKKIYLNDGKL